MDDDIWTTPLVVEDYDGWIIEVPYDGSSETLERVPAAIAELDPPEAKVTPGPCSCECAGCDQMGMHCMKAAQGCGWRKR